MATETASELAALYERDETAWLDTNSERIRAGRLDEVDYANLAEFLSDMANRDRREVTSRLAVLIAHLWKCRHQPERRSRSWEKTIVVQRGKLEDLIESTVLRIYAAEVLPKAYTRAVQLAVVETALPESTFPTDCPFSLEDVLSGPIERDAE